jgi:hypothetical protein
MSRSLALALVADLCVCASHKTPLAIGESKQLRSVCAPAISPSPMTVPENFPASRLRRALPPEVSPFLPEGYRDETYLAWERGHKANAHREWNRVPNQPLHSAMPRDGEFAEVALRASALKPAPTSSSCSRKMALRDAVKSAVGAKRFATGLYEFLYGPGTRQKGDT